MPTFYDTQNNAYQIAEQLGRGGEGTVYACDDSNIVAKIYHELPDADKAEKLRWMAANKDENLLKVAAWVVDVLHDLPNGKVVGFLMPSVRAKEIHELYSLKSRRVYFPEATWHFLVHAAANVARAFYALHKNSHIMGDVNHGNCVVLADGTVKLIDCDSYSVKIGDARWKCDVGVATHLAPELQGVNLAEIEREEKHDNFGLAVIIFQLLFLGRHPFAGNYTGAEDKSLEDCIRELRFAYGDNAEFTKVKQPPGTLSLDQISPRLATMFERAFLTEERPEPREWIEALINLEENLEQCALHPGHHYFNELASCPFCALEAQTGVMLFPFVNSITADGERTFNIFTVENLLNSFGAMRNLPAKPFKTEILLPPSPDVFDRQQTVRRRQWGLIFGQFFMLVFLMTFFGYGIGVFFGIILMIICLVMINNADSEAREEYNFQLDDKRQKWIKFENDWSNAAITPQMENDLIKIRKKIEAHRGLQTSSFRQLKSIGEEDLQARFVKYLHSFRVAEMNLPELGGELLEYLKINGIKTAADIEPQRLDSLARLSSEVKAGLLKRRAKIENKFDYEEKRKQITAKRADLAAETAARRHGIEREIENLFGALRSGSLHLQRRQQELLAQSEKFAAELAQAESNLKAFGNSAMMILILLAVTFFTPFFGALLSADNARPAYKKSAVDYSNPDAYSGSGIGIGEPGRGSTTDASSNIDELDVPDENITDAEIAELPDYWREKYVNNLYAQAMGLTLKETNVEANRRAAERKLKLGLRLNADDVATLNQLGYVLYDEGKYDESLKYLKHSQKLDADDARVKDYIGMIYLRRKNYSAARDILVEATKKESKMSEAFYNLGLAYSGLKQYDLAADAFIRAIEIYPEDVDAHYELGLTYAKIGKMNAAEEQYRILLDKDEDRAEKLRKDANLTVAPPLKIDKGYVDN